jgi:rubrerythrin
LVPVDADTQVRLALVIIHHQDRLGAMHDAASKTIAESVKEVAKTNDDNLKRMIENNKEQISNMRDVIREMRSDRQMLPMKPAPNPNEAGGS